VDEAERWHLAEFVPFIATPTHDNRVHGVYAQGLLTAWATFLGCRLSLCNGTSLARQRDMLVAQFSETDCTHLLFVDSDIEWTCEDAIDLALAGKDFIGGTYCRKNPSKPLTASLLEHREGELVEVAHIGTGFLLVSRVAVEAMLTKYAADVYESGGRKFVSLFSQNIHEGTEDVSFCRRWRDMGESVWMHTGVVLPHYDGGTPYVADVSALRTSQFRSTPAAAE
jgi:hypothetical protein